MAFTLSLIVGAALLVQTLRNVYAADTGLSLEGVSELFLAAPDGVDPQEFDALGGEIAASVASVAGVGGVAVSTNIPHVGAGMMERVWLSETSEEEGLYWAFGVAPGWFEFFGIEAVEGRTLRNEDRSAGSPQPVVLTSALSRVLFRTVEVVGRRVFIGGTESRVEYEVVGVVSDIFGAEQLREPRLAFFTTLGAAAPFNPQLNVFARTQPSGQLGLAGRIQDAIGEIVPDQPLNDLVPVTNWIDRVYQAQIMLGRLLALLSVLTVLLSAAGLYGLVSFNVASRAREFSVRSAVGAPRQHLALVVARYAGVVVLLGAVFGLGGAYALSQAIESRLFGVEAVDPTSYLGGLAVLLLAAALACLRPTLLASRVDPATVLRHD
jgi:hypothetical protein